MNNFDEIMNKPAFDSISQEQKFFYKQLMTQVQGKTGMETMMILMEFSKKAPKGNSVSTQDQELMISAITESLPKKDKDNFLRLIKTMGMLSNKDKEKI